MDVSEGAFTDTIDKWMADVRREAVALFRAGVAHEHCVNVAMKIVEGKDIERAPNLQALGFARPQ